MNYLAAQQADTGNEKEDWATLMGHLMMAQRADPQTMLGFGLGQLLRDAAGCGCSQQPGGAVRL